MAFLKSHGLKALNADLSVFVKPGLIVAVYVDNLQITGSSFAEIQAVKKALSERFHMSDLESCQYYLGMTVTRDQKNRVLRLGQWAYLEKILRNHKMTDCKAAPTPMKTQHLEVSPPDYEPTTEFRLQYQSAVGSLMYAMLGTRPDLAYAVSVVSRYASRPNNSHWQAFKRIFQYIKGTLDLELTFKGPLKPLAGYTDADWAGDLDTRRSTSGFLFNLGSGAISWSSKRQPTVALSSCEAEYMGQTQAIKEAVWLKSLLDQLNPEDSIDSPTRDDSQTTPLPLTDTSAYALKATIIYCDNQGAVALAKNPESHARSKHIDIQWHYQREKIADGSVTLKYVPTSEHIADGLTKPLAKEKFLIFRKALGLEAYPSRNT